MLLECKISLNTVFYLFILLKFIHLMVYIEQEKYIYITNISNKINL